MPDESSILRQQIETAFCKGISTGYRASVLYWIAFREANIMDLDLLLDDGIDDLFMRMSYYNQRLCQPPVTQADLWNMVNTVVNFRWSPEAW
jgi:hypothetical protein